MYILKEYIYIDGQLDDVDVILSENRESLIRYIMNETGNKDVWDYMSSYDKYADELHQKIYVIEQK